ncbi:MAG TPA: HEAT repeat domain-containing protein [Bryobacteraceae bacterium]|nr:HEAT repeat domain-containing protein [Bryobacteraceae bacterium]
MISLAVVLAVTLAQDSSAVEKVAPNKSAESAAWSVLDEALNGGSAEHREHGLLALSTIGEPNPEAVKRAEAALKDKDSQVRETAALALGELNATGSIPALKSALDDSPEVAFAAAKSLTRIGDPAGRDMLVAVLAGERKDGPGMVSGAVRKAKDKMHHPGDLALTGAKDATGAMFGPVSLAIPVTKDLIEMKGKGAPGRAAAAAYLARYPDSYSITLLEWALNDDEGLVRLEAAKGLGERGNADSVPKLQALLSDPHSLVRDMAAAAIIRISGRNGESGDVPACAPTPQATKKK